MMETFLKSVLSIYPEFPFGFKKAIHNICLSVRPSFHHSCKQRMKKMRVFIFYFLHLQQFVSTQSFYFKIMFNLILFCEKGFTQPLLLQIDIVKFDGVTHRYTWVMRGAVRSLSKVTLLSKYYLAQSLKTSNLLCNRKILGG